MVGGLGFGVHQGFRASGFKAEGIPQGSGFHASTETFVSLGFTQIKVKSSHITQFSFHPLQEEVKAPMNSD